MPRPFAKYEGLGNDFIVLDAADWPLADVTPGLSQRLCNRHTGIGADGILWLDEADRGNSDATLLILNADGSRPEMCGNGIRCVAAHMLSRGRAKVGSVLRIATDAGPRNTVVQRRTEAGVVTVEVDMGVVDVSAKSVELSGGNSKVSATAADAGNPHAVITTAVPEADRMAIVRAAESRRDVWPNGVNVEFAVATAGGISVSVHERGVGWTRACGTGACAVAVVSVAQGFANAKLSHAISVHLDGGALEITVTPEREGFRARMQGPARRVFVGAVSNEQSVGGRANV